MELEVFVEKEDALEESGTVHMYEYEVLSVLCCVTAKKEVEVELGRKRVVYGYGYYSDLILKPSSSSVRSGTAGGGE